MDEKRLKRLERDLKAATKVLRQNGLLLELPDSALNHYIGSRQIPAKARIFIEQIVKAKTTPDYREEADRAVKNVRRLGHLPGCLPKAMDLLVEVAEVYLADKYQIERDADAWETGEEELIPMEELMSDFIRSRYRSAETSAEDWNPSDFRYKIRSLVHGEHGVGTLYRGEDEDGSEIESDLFEEEYRLLYVIAARKAATILANKVAGHRLPPELVEMIRDFTSSDEALKSKISSDEASSKQCMTTT